MAAELGIELTRARSRYCAATAEVANREDSLTGHTPLLEMQGIAKHYQRAGKTVHALHDFSLALHAGEVLGLLGPNGAGKTTAIKVMTQLCEPDAGTLLWRGTPVRDKRYVGQIGVLLEGRGALNERLST